MWYRPRTSGWTRVSSSPESESGGHLTPVPHATATGVGREWIRLPLQLAPPHDVRLPVPARDGGPREQDRHLQPLHPPQHHRDPQPPQRRDRYSGARAPRVHPCLQEPARRRAHAPDPLGGFAAQELVAVRRDARGTRQYRARVRARPAGATVVAVGVVFASAAVPVPVAAARETAGASRSHPRLARDRRSWAEGDAPPLRPPSPPAAAGVG